MTDHTTEPRDDRTQIVVGGQFYDEEPHARALPHKYDDIHEAMADMRHMIAAGMPENRVSIRLTRDLDREREELRGLR